MQARIEEFRRLRAELLAITFVGLPRLQSYLSARRWSFPFLADPDRRAYRALGLERAGWWRLLRPRVMAAYFGLLFRGRRPRWAHEDVHQLGGDFVLDAQGRICYAFRSQDPADRPGVAELLEAVRNA